MTKSHSKVTIHNNIICKDLQLIEYFLRHSVHLIIKFRPVFVFSILFSCYPFGVKGRVSSYLGTWEEESRANFVHKNLQGAASLSSVLLFGYSFIVARVQV